jgi:hypothetical protein
VVGNAAVSGSPFRGDGIYVAAGQARIAQCTVAYNSGQGILRENGVATATNSILWGNGDDVTGTVSLAYCDIEDGDNNLTNGCISTNPAFERGFYLVTNSPCVDAGGDTAANVGMSNLTTRADGVCDTGIVDLGYHYATGLNLTLADLYVTTNGSDATGNGSTNNPYRSITKALAMASDGSRIHIGTGFYTNGVETFPISISDRSGIQLLGTNRDLTVVSAAGASKQVLALNGALGDTRVEGLTFADGGGATPHGMGISIQYSSATIANCIIRSNSFVGGIPGCYGGGVYALSSSGLMTNCNVYGNSVSVSPYSGLGAGICLWGGNWVLADSQISNNTIASASAASIGGGLYLSADTEHVVRGCVISSNDAAATRHGDGIGVAGGAVLIQNTLVVRNGGEGIYADTAAGAVRLLHVTVATNAGIGVYRNGGTVSVTNSILWANGMDATGTLTAVYSDVGVAGPGVTTSNCISVNPLFVNPAAGDYHEMSTIGSWHGGAWSNDAISSLCIDAGMPGYPYDLEPVPNGHRPNLGAYGNTPQASKTQYKGTVFRSW